MSVEPNEPPLTINSTAGPATANARNCGRACHPSLQMSHIVQRTNCRQLCSRSWHGKAMLRWAAMSVGRAAGIVDWKAHSATRPIVIHCSRLQLPSSGAHSPGDHRDSEATSRRGVWPLGRDATRFGSRPTTAARCLNFALLDGHDAAIMQHISTRRSALPLKRSTK